MLGNIYLSHAKSHAARDEPSGVHVLGNLWRKSDKARWKIIAYGASWAFWGRAATIEYINERKGLSNADITLITPKIYFGAKVVLLVKNCGA